jgi:hypothetical protein
MRSIKITGLCLVAMFAMSMVASATASAEAPPVWKQCREGTVSPTKYTDGKCSVLSSTGKYEWIELTTTEKVFSEATLRLYDTKTAAGESEVECSGTTVGSIGPGKYDRTETVTVASCRALKVCENPVTATAVDLPWQTELYESAKEQRDKITEVPPHGEPGWKIECKVLFKNETDECKTVAGEEGSTSMTDITVGTKSIVQATFETKSGLATCTLSKAKTGIVGGIVRTEPQGGGWSIQVS